MIPFLAAALILLALVLLWMSARQKRATGLPGGRIIYADTRRWGAVEKPLYDARLNLAGKPDYLVEQGDAIIPVEVKSSMAPSSPRDSHIFQLAAYCLLVERSKGRRPPYGILHYRNQTFAIDYTAELETALLDLLAEMRRREKSGEANRSHDQPPRCDRCGFRSICDQRLG